MTLRAIPIEFDDPEFILPSLAPYRPGQYGRT